MAKWFAMSVYFSEQPRVLHFCELVRNENAGAYIVRLLAYCAREDLEGALSAVSVEHVAQWRGRRGALLRALVDSGCASERGDRIVLTDWIPVRQTIAMEVRRALAVREGGTQGAVVRVRCPRCGMEGVIDWTEQRVRFEGLHVDHIRPVTRGGSSKLDNLQLLCGPCNMRKGARIES